MVPVPSVPAFLQIVPAFLSQIVKLKTANGFTVGELYVAPGSGIKAGAKVSAGQVIGTAQDIRVRTGPKVTPHIHVQIRDSGGQRVNPETLIPAP